MYTEQYNQLNRQRVDWQTEEEVRLGWLTILQNTLAITFHAERGRSDADYNQVIIEFKNVGLFHGNQNSAKFQEALEELSRYMQSSQIAELHPHGYPKQKRKLSKTIGFYMIISVHLNSSCGVAPHIGQECLPLHIMRYIMWVAIHLRHGK